jgi:hypothetical protein
MAELEPWEKKENFCDWGKSWRQEYVLWYSRCVSLLIQVDVAVGFVN